jgi:hypothetical protein
MKGHAIVREKTDSGCVIFKHTKMMKPDEANRIKMRALYKSLLLTELSFADEAAEVAPRQDPPNNPKPPHKDVHAYGCQIHEERLQFPRPAVHEGGDRRFISAHGFYCWGLSR